MNLREVIKKRNSLTYFNTKTSELLQDFLLKLYDRYDHEKYVFINLDNDISMTNKLVRVSNKLKKSDNELRYIIEDFRHDFSNTMLRKYSDNNDLDFVYHGPDEELDDFEDADFAQFVFNDVMTYLKENM